MLRAIHSESSRSLHAQNAAAPRTAPTDSSRASSAPRAALWFQLRRLSLPALRRLQDLSTTASLNKRPKSKKPTHRCSGKWALDTADLLLVLDRVHRWPEHTGTCAATTHAHTHRVLAVGDHNDLRIRNARSACQHKDSRAVIPQCEHDRRNLVSEKLWPPIVFSAGRSSAA